MRSRYECALLQEKAIRGPNDNGFRGLQMRPVNETRQPVKIRFSDLRNCNWPELADLLFQPNARSRCTATLAEES